MQFCKTNRRSLQASQKGLVASLGTGAGLSKPGIVDIVLPFLNLECRASVLPALFEADYIYRDIAGQGLSGQLSNYPKLPVVSRQSHGPVIAGVLHVQDRREGGKFVE